MIIRIFGLYLNFIYNVIKYRKIVKFKGFTVVYAFKGSSINFDNGGGIFINSHPLSNLIGLYQRSIIVARYGGEISIGKNSSMSGSTIYAMSKITIGENTMIGGNCKIIDNDFHPLLPELRIHQKSEDIKKRPIEIGNNCFIGTNSLILKGTTIGSNCVIGAGSVVSGVFPDNVIIAGNPARIIKNLYH